MNEEHTLSLEELGEIKTVKVYNQAYVDKQQERIETLEKENAELKEDNDARKFAMAMSEKVEKQLREENAKLKKEVLEVRQHLELTEREWGKDTTKFILCKTQLTKAKDIIKELVKGVRITFDHKGFITDVDAFVSKAEQFLKEVER